MLHARVLRRGANFFLILSFLSLSPSFSPLVFNRTECFETKNKISLVFPETKQVAAEVAEMAAEAVAEDEEVRAVAVVVAAEVVVEVVEEVVAAEAAAEAAV
jgi:hypothetical protein